MKCAMAVTFICALLSFGYAEDVSNNSRMKSALSTFGSPFLTKTEAPRPTVNPAHTRRQRAVAKDSCFVPEQLANGVRRRHKHYCGDDVEYCNIREGVELAPGTLLTYTCNAGYKISGNSLVLCKGHAEWSTIPVCIEVKCEPLNSMSKTARCFRSARWVNCDSSVLQGTRAKLTCRPGYMEATTSMVSQSKNVECNMDGKWEPEPIECVPACGVALYGTTNETTDFPWHASIYKKYSDEGEIYFKCGATVIRTNLLLTAASCVYEDETNSTADPKRLFVMTGNSFQDYNHPFHDPKTVTKNAVKSVYIHCDYNEITFDTRPADIALVEIVNSFEFSSNLLPACLDNFAYDMGEEILEPGAYGSIAEFGATTIGSRPIAKDILSIKTVPYVPYSQCKDSDKVMVKESLTADKFCAGYSDRSSICVNNDGGGLVFQKNDLWYVIGVVSQVPAISFSGNALRCSYYVLYTNVSEYTAWIQDVIFNLERYKSHPPCDSNWTATRVATVNPTNDDNPILPMDNNPSCTAPPQPANGKWKFHHSLCMNEEDCDMLKAAPLRPGTLIFYMCDSGYMANGNTEVYCGFSGNWSSIPVCSQIKCDPLNSVSTRASCTGHSGERISCDLPVSPNTRAEISCHAGYRKDMVFTASRREIVQCSKFGRWEPEPIRCVPACGLAITRQTPFVINGSTAIIGDFPWHATLYVQKKSSRGTSREFICGATIIHTNFLLTAAHCVYDETNKRTQDPKKLFVMTGNIFRDYDFPFHDPQVVRKAAVKNVYTTCNYYGLRGNYISDIALLELDKPFTFSSILLPACLDVDGHSKQILEPGVYGRVAGFGRTATGRSSGILQTLTLPYISYYKCKMSKNADKNDVFISDDKFCAGYTNGSAVCEGDSGGGLVFLKNELWYVLGIVSLGLDVDLNNGERTCDKYSYSLYTKVSEYIVWIQDVLFQVEQYKSYPSCDAQLV